MSNRLERLEKALAVCCTALRGLSTLGGTSSHGNIAARRALEAVDIILNPPPEMETVEVVRWAVVNPAGSVQTTSAIEGDAKNLAKSLVRRGREEFSVIKLTGTITRPKPEPVEKSVSVECGWVPVSTPHGPKIYYPATIDHGFDWGQFEGKTGTLTFTWTQGA